MGGLSFMHLLILLVILLIFMGPGRLPQLGESLGKALRGFKDGLDELNKNVDSKPRPTPHAQGSTPPADEPITVPPATETNASTTEADPPQAEPIGTSSKKTDPS